jgi:phage replication-related protein YjqB (UPF0714/DUF867 family)
MTAAFAELLQTPGVEERMVLRSGFGFLAIHAGVEGGTLEVAMEAAERAEASFYAVTQPEGLARHVPSVEITPDVSLRLTAFLLHVETVVSLHGHWRMANRRAVWVGGRNRLLAGVLAGRLRDAVPDYDVVDELDDIPPRMRGLHPKNPVNRPRRSGAQLELPPTLRGARADRAPGDPCVPHPAVVETLADVASAWQD